MRQAKRLLFILALLVCVGCVRDQQAARTRLPGVDKQPAPQQQDPKDPDQPDSEGG